MRRLRMSGTEAVLSCVDRVNLTILQGQFSCVEIEYIRFHLNNVCYVGEERTNG